MSVKGVLWWGAAALLPAFALACGGDDKDDETIFEVGRANEAAHAALIDVPDLPAGGWEVSERDEPEDDSFDFEAAARNEPACATFNNLAALGTISSIFGEKGQSPSAGRAQVEIERRTSGQQLPTSVEMEVEISPTVAETQGSWQLAKGLLESEDFKRCMSRVISGLFETEAPSGVQLTFAPKPSSSAAPPEGGATVAFLMTLNVQQVINIRAVLEMYLWPYANAGVSVMVVGTEQEVTPALVNDLLKAAEAKVVQAEKDF